MVVLIAVSSGDVASYHQAECLLAMGDWEDMPDVEHQRACARHQVRMWWLPDGCLREDHLDLRWQQATGEVVDEVIFPSRHSAASGQASLTLHPIGVMQLGKDERPPYGGKAGDCPPPSPRLGPWWRELLKHGSELDDFSLSLETTHHGPWLKAPSLFIEIGSTEDTWDHMGAAELLAGIIWRGLGLEDGILPALWPGEGVVVVTLGGGHYAPRANKLAAIPGVWLGHMLANYALPFEAPEVEGETPSGNWSQSISAAISSTREAFPGGQLVATLERKSFKAWQRNAIIEYLASLDVPVVRTKDIEAMLQ